MLLCGYQINFNQYDSINSTFKMIVLCKDFSSDNYIPQFKVYNSPVRPTIIYYFKLRLLLRLL